MIQFVYVLIHYYYIYFIILTEEDKPLYICVPSECSLLHRSLIFASNIYNSLKVQGSFYLSHTQLYRTFVNH